MKRIGTRRRRCQRFFRACRTASTKCPPSSKISTALATRADTVVFALAKVIVAPCLLKIAVALLPGNPFSLPSIRRP